MMTAKEYTTDELTDRYEQIELAKLNEAQKLFCELMRPLWILSSQQTGRPRYVCKLRFLIWLQDELGQTASEIKKFRDYTNDDIARAINICEPLLNQLES